MNATDLFVLPKRSFHNSESWWTAFFSMWLLYESSSSNPRPLRVCNHGDDQRFAWTGELDITGLTAANLISEGPLSREVFGLLEWPNSYRGLRPDVTILRPERRMVAFIEVKTVGASVSGNVLLYEEVATHLRNLGWAADVFYLLSCGYEGNWRTVTEYKLRLILWESILQRAKGSPLGLSLRIDLEPYSILPAELGDHGA